MRCSAPVLALLAAIVGLGYLLAGCQWIPGTDAHAVREAEKAVRYQLNDPDAGQFRNERVIKSGEQRMVCGEINAKNRMGAYVGFRPYAYLVKPKSVEILPQLDGSTEAALASLDFPKECAA